MKSPKVSVIMAVYNAGSTLVEAIESVINQTFTDWEIVICDDCSDDGTAQVLASYQKVYPDQIFLLKNEINSKLAYSLNRCLEHAKGEYIARMDGDDISLPERFEKQVEFLDKYHEYDVVGTAMIPFDSFGDRPRRIKKEFPTKMDLLKSPAFNHATIMMRKSTFDTLGGYTVSSNTTRSQDYELWFRFFKAGFRGYNMPQAHYKVRESLQDYDRRTGKVMWNAVKLRWNGFRLLNFPPWYYIFVLKPLIVAVIPSKYMFYYHKHKT